MSEALPPKGAFRQWMILPLRRYARFTGRSGRREFWWFSMLQFGFYSVATILMGVFLFVGIPQSDFGELGNGGAVGTFVILLVIVMLFYVAMFVPTLAVTVRRLHDIGISGWVALPLYLAGWLLSVIGWIIYAVVMALPGKEAANRYGPPVYDDQLATVFE